MHTEIKARNIKRIHPLWLFQAWHK